MDGRQLRPIDEPLTVVGLRLVGGSRRECLVRRAAGGAGEWVGCERVKEADVLAYYRSLVPSVRPRTTRALLDRLAAVDDAVAEAVARSLVRSAAGLALPPSGGGARLEAAAQRLRDQFDPRADAEYAAHVAELRKSAVVERLAAERAAQAAALRALAKAGQQAGRPFRAENRVDLERPPAFEFADGCRATGGVRLPEAEGCDCADGCGSARCPCVRRGDGPVRAAGRLRPQVALVGECHARCRCADCANRATSDGCPYPLVLFRTFNGCGWGVRTAARIEEGGYVLTYAGEVITAAEKRRRASPYVFAPNERWTRAQQCLFVDALNVGNLSRFVNHSCEPNLRVVKVLGEVADERLPRIAFFAGRAIASGEELCIDYGRAYRLAQCRCGRRRCCGAKGDDE